MSDIDRDARWLVKKIADMSVALRALVQPQLGNSSIEAGRIEEYDGDGNLVSIHGEQHDGTHASVTVAGPPPPEPVAPSATVKGNLVTVRWSGRFIEGQMSPMDFSHVSVHASRLEVFPPDNTTQVATINGESGDVASVLLEPGEWSILLVAVSLAGKWSDPSDAIAVEVAPMLDPSDIVDSFVHVNEAMDNFDGRLADVQQSVSGKNTIFNDVEPPMLGTYVAGDIWQMWSSLEEGGRLLKGWRYTLGAWFEVSMDESYLPMVNIGQGTYGELNGGRLQADSIRAQSLLLTSDNLVEAAKFEAESSWSVPDAGASSGWDVAVRYLDAPRSYRLEQKPAGTANMSLYMPQSNFIAVDPNEWYRVRSWVRPTGVLPAGLTGIAQQVYFYDADQVQLPSTPGNLRAGLMIASPAANTWQEVGGMVQAPAGAVFMRPRATVYFAAGATPNAVAVNVGQVQVVRAADANLIVNGSIDGMTITGAVVRTSGGTDRVEMSGNTLTAYGKVGAIPVNVVIGPGVVGVSGSTAKVVGVGFANGTPYPAGLYSDGTPRITMTSAGIGGAGDSRLVLASNGSGNSELYSWPPMDFTARGGITFDGVNGGIELKGSVLVPAAPLGLTSAVNKAYADGLVTPTVLPTTSTNLNNYTVTALWIQTSNVGAAAGTNYPSNQAGLLEVIAVGVFVFQRYTVYNTGVIHSRTKYNSTWNGWRTFSTQSSESGKVTISGPVAAGGVSGSIAVTFPAGLFSGEPNITFGTNDARVSPNITGLSATGCSIRAFNYTTAATTASPTIWWNAVQG